MQSRLDQIRAKLDHISCRLGERGQGSTTSDEVSAGFDQICSGHLWSGFDKVRAGLNQYDPLGIGLCGQPPGLTNCQPDSTDSGLGSTNSGWPLTDASGTRPTCTVSEAETQRSWAPAPPSLPLSLLISFRHAPSGAHEAPQRRSSNAQATPERRRSASGDETALKRRRYVARAARKRHRACAQAAPERRLGDDRERRE